MCKQVACIHAVQPFREPPSTPFALSGGIGPSLSIFICIENFRVITALYKATKEHGKKSMSKFKGKCQTYASRTTAC